MDRDFITKCILRELVFQANKHFVSCKDDKDYLNNLSNYNNVPDFCYEVLNCVYRSGLPLKHLDQAFEKIENGGENS